MVLSLVPSTSSRSAAPVAMPSYKMSPHNLTSSTSKNLMVGCQNLPCHNYTRPFSGPSMPAPLRSVRRLSPDRQLVFQAFVARLRRKPIRDQRNVGGNLEIPPRCDLIAGG